MFQVADDSFQKKKAREAAITVVSKSRQAHFSYMHYTANIVVWLVGKGNLTHYDFHVVFHRLKKKLFVVFFYFKVH